MSLKIFLLLLWIGLAQSNSMDDIPSDLLPMEARHNENLQDSQEEEIIATSYVLPNQIFNDGKSYYAGKDPVSGQLDFNAKKTTGIETAANEVINENEKVVLAAAMPNIHDYLNLPVKYSPSKFVYPLVSSSYANLKYQGSNKNYITDKKPTSAPATPGLNYHSSNYFTIPTTKLKPVQNVEPLTTRKPSTPTTRTTTITTTTTTTTTTTRAPPTTTTTARPTTESTRKKFVPTKKYIPTHSYNPSTIETSTSPIKTSPITTFSQTVSETPFFPVNDTDIKPLEIPVHSDRPTSVPDISTKLPQLHAADVYYNMEQKYANKNEQKPQTVKKPTMTLDDLFNTLAEEESAVISNTKGNQGLDIKGNLIQPLAPSQPTPFATQIPTGNTQQQQHYDQQQKQNEQQLQQQIQQHQKQQLQNQQAQEQYEIQKQQQQQYQAQQQQFQAQQQQQQQLQQMQQNQNNQMQHPQQYLNQDQKVISGSQENFGNEYVSYQVQQPNVMQYRPVPGAINNVVISPGQQSASFVLGSQQQVGNNAYGTSEKQPLYNPQGPMQYGTVINEDINTLKRPEATIPSVPTTYQQMIHKTNTNFHQPPALYRPEELDVPEPPSPYQKLPLIASKLPKKKPQLQQQQQQQPQAISQPEQQQNLQSQPPQSVNVPESQVPQSQLPSSEVKPAQDTKEMLVSSNIRFPANEEDSTAQSSALVSQGPLTATTVNGHAQPYSLQQLQTSNPVVFPKTTDEGSEYSTGSNVQIQQHEVLTMNQHKQKLSFPTQLKDQIAPVQHMTPPPRFPATFANTIDGESAQKRIQRPNGPPNYVYKELVRKPNMGIQRPSQDQLLPNILPQFRPNAKLSTGHGMTNFNQEPGNIHLTGPQKRPMQLSQFTQRRQSLLQPKRFPINRMPDYPSPQTVDANRRLYRLPPYAASVSQYNDRLYPRHPMPPNMSVERHASPIDSYKTLPEDVLTSERLAAFEEEGLSVNDPPQPVTPGKLNKLSLDSNAEPVATLQMLQTQKKTQTYDPDEETGSGEIKVPPLNDQTAAADNSQKGLFVVYPVKGENVEKTEYSEKKDVLPAIAHIEAPTGSEYQNTPFSIIRDQPQEPILKNKKPQSLQQQTRVQSPKDRFPYPIEKPDPSLSELNDKQSASISVLPRIISAGPSSHTESPIAYAYTPTSYRHQPSDISKYSNVNLASSVIGEIRTDTQTEEGPSVIYDSRVQNLEHNFMAPFYPSVSLDRIAPNTPSNGWNIIPSTSTEYSIYEKNRIDRSDVQIDVTEESTAKPFTGENFQPELQGGFMPIYPPGYQIVEEEEKEVISPKLNNIPIALASRMDPPINFNTDNSNVTSTVLEAVQTSTESSIKNVTSTLTTTTDSTDVNSTTKKSLLEASLEALLFGDDDLAKIKKEKLQMTKSGPRNIPRMGPRNIKLS